MARSLSRNKIIWILSAISLVIMVSVLVFTGNLWLNKLFALKYSVKGIDVSHYQMNISWQKAAGSGIRFVFIKASEGSTNKDASFQQNWEGAKDAGLIRGAYHYFTLASAGKMQAANFISCVPLESGCLPPVIDLEEMGADEQIFRSELDDFISAVESRFGQKPILYVVYPVYDRYIRGYYDDYPIWIRDMAFPPRLSDGRGWLFWQYCDRGRVEGISTFVDLDVFSGSSNELEALLSN
ncbi:MAG: GH25 family lysozyme [Bacillota bacterium]|nr:GH25 family lysozyme [Bacillota bacterium]